ncbi:MAG: metal ABC transporter ATP-binding protein, partial [Bacillota bacterium]
METIIEIKDVDFSYRNNTVLEKVNLEIEKEDFTAFIGPNGSGKTTLMELIVGNLKPERGIITLFGENSDKYKKWKNISYIPQKVKDFNKSFPATVKEIIASDLYQKMGFIKIMTEDIEGRIKEVLDLVGMGEYKNRKIGNLSGGQQQRIFLARSLSSNPEV